MTFLRIVIPLYLPCSRKASPVHFFLLGVLVEQQARRFIATTDVDSDAGVTVTCEMGMVSASRW